MNPALLYFSVFSLSFYFISTIFVLLLLSYSFDNYEAHSQSGHFGQINNNSAVTIKNYSKYFDPLQNVVVIGSVIKHDNHSYPQNITVGINVLNKLTNETETLIEKPYNPILYRNNEPFPFKIVINTTKYSIDGHYVQNVVDNQSTVASKDLMGEPFIFKSENITTPYTKINTFELKYPVFPQGPSKDLHGNVTNTGPYQLDNLTLFAIVNDINGVQIDSVKTIIPKLEPNQTVDFTFTPSPAIKDRVYFYSCVGGDPANMRVDKYKLFTISNYKVLGYKHSDMMVLDEMYYNQTNNQLDIRMNNVYPLPAAVSIQIMPYQINPLSVYLDGDVHDNVKTKYADDMVQLDFTVPHGSHEIALSGIEEF